MKNLYTEKEIILCAYIARFGRDDFNESHVVRIKNRSLSSIKMKVQNIAAMIEEEGYECNESVSKLKGLPTGQTGRRTNWDIVKKYVDLCRADHKRECMGLFLRSKNDWVMNDTF